MKPGVPNGNFLADCFDLKVSDETMRQRWKEGHYGEEGERPPAEYVREWRRLAGRNG